MRRYKGFDDLVKHYDGIVNKTIFCDLLINDLKQACCSIYGETVDDESVLLAELKVQQDSLCVCNGMFQQRIEFIVTGKIINAHYPALTYSVKGDTAWFYGRCSTIPQVCGVDLYLDKSYTERVGDVVTQKFTIPVNKLSRSVVK